MITNKILIVDGSSYLYRAFHTPSLSRLTTPNGELSGTLFGFNRSLNLFIEKHQPTHCCVVFDPRGKTKRNDYFPQYKANRPPTPPEIIKAFEQVKELLCIRNIKQTQVSKEEADDVIGSLSKKLQSPENFIIIASGDKDLGQLVSDQYNVKITNIKNGFIETLDEEGIKNKMGVYPDKVADYLALMGDAVDNIPGVPGVGAKTAVKLINEHGGLDDIVKNNHLIKGKIGKTIEENKENIPLYRRLTEIDCNIHLDENLVDIELSQEQDDKNLSEYYTKIGFVSEVSKLQKKNGTEASYETPNKKPITIIQNIEEWINIVSQTDSTEKVLLIQNKSNFYTYIPAQKTLFGIDKKGLNVSYETNKIIQQKIKNKIIAYDWKNIIYEININSIGLNSLDLMLAFYLLFAGKESPAWKNAIRIISQLQKQEETIDIEGLEFEEDLIKVFQSLLFFEDYFYQQIEKDSHIKALYEKIEKPLEKILLEIESRGVYIDAQRLQKTDDLFLKQIGELQVQIYEISKEPFNIDSPKQVGEVLYKKLNLPVLQKTPTGTPSTNEETLQSLSDAGHQIAEKIIEYRGLAKLKSTYTTGLVKHITSENRIHTRLNQTVAATGRLSSSDPNLQNIPIKTKNGKLIRESFCAPENRVLIAADYSQIELRILAHETQDEQLIKAFREGLDIHSMTASNVFNQPQNSISAEQRRYAKTINFGLIYGMSSFSLGKQLKITPLEAKQWVETYFNQFPKIQSYMEEVKKRAQKQEWVSTIMGRKIHVPDINSRNYKLRSYAERAAINAPIQGAAADIIKLAMIKIHETLSGKKDIDLVLQIHDELLFEVDKNRAEYYKTEIENVMKNVISLSVPLKVEVGIATNWAEAH